MSTDSAALNGYFNRQNTSIKTIDRMQNKKNNFPTFLQKRLFSFIGTARFFVYLARDFFDTFVLTFRYSEEKKKKEIPRFLTESTT